MFRAIRGILGVCIVLGAAGGSAAGEPRRTGWYVGAGTGVNWSSSMKQVGHTRDTTCYPNNDCSHLHDGMPDGYRQRYDLEPAAGGNYSLSNKTLLSLKLVYTQVGDIKDRGSYLVHPVGGLTNLTKISSMDHWSLMIIISWSDNLSAYIPHFDSPSSHGACPAWI